MVGFKKIPSLHSWDPEPESESLCSFPPPNAFVSLSLSLSVFLRLFFPPHHRWLARWSPLAQPLRILPMSFRRAVNYAKTLRRWCKSAPSRRRSGSSRSPLPPASCSRRQLFTAPRLLFKSCGARQLHQRFVSSQWNPLARRWKGRCESVQADVTGESGDGGEDGRGAWVVVSGEWAGLQLWQKAAEPVSAWMLQCGNSNHMIRSKSFSGWFEPRLQRRIDWNP